MKIFISCNNETITNLSPHVLGSTQTLTPINNSIGAQHSTVSRRVRFRGGCTHPTSGPLCNSSPLINSNQWLPKSILERHASVVYGYTVLVTVVWILFLCWQIFSIPNGQKPIKSTIKTSSDTPFWLLTSEPLWLVQYVVVRAAGAISVDDHVIAVSQSFNLSARIGFRLLRVKFVPWRCDVLLEPETRCVNGYGRANIVSSICSYTIFQTRFPSMAC